MKKPALLILSALVTCISSARAAEPYPAKAYDAVYQRTNDTGVSKYRMSSDGKGHMRTESHLPGSDNASIVIFDYPKKEMLMLLTAQKMVMKMPLKADASAPADEDRIKQLGGKSLGKRLIDGRPCHGWTYNVNGTTIESWTGDNTGCLVESVTISDTKKESLHLISFSAAAPAASDFAAPSGYKEVAGFVPGANPSR